MSHEFYVTAKGTTQTKFKGESPREAHKDKIAGFSFRYVASSTYDARKGTLVDRCQHEPVVFTKEWGAASPQLLQALWTGEQLTSVLFEFVKHDAKGKEIIYYTITLHNARVVAVKKYSGKLVHEQDETGTHELEDISLTCQKIEVHNVESQTESHTDWLTQ